MVNHTEQDIIDLFDKDVEDGRIEIVTKQFLKRIGRYRMFLQHVEELRILFDERDLGEVYAISIAKTLGCSCLVTDYIKE